VDARAGPQSKPPPVRILRPLQIAVDTELSGRRSRPSLKKRNLYRTWKPYCSAQRLNFSRPVLVPY